MNRTTCAALLTLSSPLALAHPGEHHAGLLETIAHLLSAPDHVLMLLLAVLAGVAAARYHRRHARLERRAPAGPR